MGTWSPMAILIAAQITLRLIGLVSLVWGERGHAESRRIQMETAANCGTVLCERHADGTVLIIIPLTTGREQVSAAESLAASGVASAVTTD